MADNTARVKVLYEAVDPKAPPEGWRLCLQWVEYQYPTQANQKGYRFIWRRPDGSLQAARGQARIESMAQVHDLLAEAQRQGWGGLSG